MRVGFFIPSVGRGGVESSLSKLLHALSDSGLELTLFYGEAPTDWLESINSSIEVTRLSKKTLVPFMDRAIDERASLSLLLIRDLTRHLKTGGYDVLVGYQSGAAALFAKWRAGVDTRVVVRESIVPSIAYEYEASRWSFLKKRVKSYSFSRADAVVSVCRGAADDLVENFGVPEQSIEVVFNPAVPDNIEELKSENVDHPWFDPSSITPVMVSVGRLSPQKDVATSLRAIAQIAKTREIRFVVVGVGPLEPQLRNLVTELGIEKNVWFAGYQTNPYKFMARSDVFVLTSVYEGIANVLAEALASGVPVVATDCPTGPTEVLLDGRAGILVPVGDHNAVASAIEKTLDDPAIHQSFGQGIRESLERFQPEAATKAYLDLLSRITS